MGSFKTPVFFLRKGASSFHHVLWVLAIALALGIGPATQAWQEARIEQVQTEDISAAGFSRIVREFSEEDGFFRSDNFVSNETSYLHILDKLRVMGGSGGAYIGVGPEQNFTYIAKMRPRIAFIVDIRRQAMLQHLLYKALFHVSETRAQFLSGLLSRPLTGEQALRGGASVDELIDYFRRAEASEEASA